MKVRETPLTAIHEKLGARMIEFAGWKMPVQYHSALQEHLAVRQSAGVFDVSHMGELEVVGPDALNLVQKLTCNDAARLADGQAQYSAFLYPDGTFVDDIVVYRIHEKYFLICVNAANKEKDLAWVLQHQEGDVEVVDGSHNYIQLALQGPQSASILQKLTEIDLHQIRFYHFAQARVTGVEALVSRTGYTGEDGFEIYAPPGSAEMLWTSLFEAGREAGLSPAGLAARNTLRLEMKYSLYGNDIDNTTTPLEAGLGWIVKLSKPDFIGKEALEHQKASGIKRTLVGFEMTGRGIARDHYPVWVGGHQVGEVCSGSYGPSVDRAIGLSYLPSEFAAVGQELSVEIRGKQVAAVVVQTPFYRRKQSTQPQAEESHGSFHERKDQLK